LAWMRARPRGDGNLRRDLGRLLPVRFPFQEPEKQTFGLSLALTAPADICDVRVRHQFAR
jgi:hypothetical protein